ncbi:GSCOCG00009899001-RA-CDS [Cotesia congregata]|nr:GSCOCG00009899001-RA-CDS [Cotesia congregata]
MEGGCSHSEKHSVVYTWEINEVTSFFNAAKSTKVSKEIRSPTFSSSMKVKDSWNLHLKIGENSEKKFVIALFLELRNAEKEVRTRFSIFILNGKKEKIYVNNIRATTTNEQTFFNDRFFVSPATSLGYENFAVVDEIFSKKDEFLPNDTLTVCVDLTVYDDYVKVKNQVKSLENSKRKLGDDLKDLFIAKKRCDVIIHVGDQKFDVHKFILTARSCVFEAMFSYDMKENKKNEINIPDIDPEVFSKVIDYIYTDKVDELETFAEELLEASDKYQLQGLKEMCEDFLITTLTLGNAVRILILADRYNAKRLKKVAINYVADNFVKFKNTKELKALEEAQVLLFLAVLKKYSIEK